MSDAVAVQPAPHAERVPGWSLLARHAGALGTVAVLLVALAVRLVELWDVPRFTDETDEVMRGLAIARGELLPLTDVDAYIGPLWNYLLAAGFLAAGPSTAVPRVLALLGGLATVVAALLLGAELARRVAMSQSARLVGLGAGLLLATSSFHALVSSRIAWSHSLTPLWTTLCLALLLRWERSGAGWCLIGAGLAYGLAVHTHPTALALAPGLAVWAALNWQRLAGVRAAYLAVVASIVVLAPLILFNLATGLASAAAAAQVQAAYGGADPLTPTRYLQQLGALLQLLPVMLDGEIGERRGATVDAGGLSAAVYAVLALVGLAVTLRRHVWLPALVILSTAVVLPLVNGKYEPMFNGRYVAPLLPLGFGLVAAGVAGMSSTLPVGRRVLAIGLALLVLAVPPVLSLRAYVDAALRDGPNNRELYQALDLVSAAQPTGPILFDATISGTRLATSREGVGVLEYVLILDGRLPVRRLQPDALVAEAMAGSADIVVVSPALATRLAKDVELRPLPGEDAARRRRRAGFTLLRVDNPP